MSTRHLLAILSAAVSLGLAACGGGGGGGSAHPLGEQVVVQHTQLVGTSAGPSTTLGVTVLKVRKGTQAELRTGGFRVDPKNRDDKPYYVDVRYTNKGAQAIKRDLGVSLEDQDGNLISSTLIFDYGGRPFEKCPRVTEGKLAPGQSYESCTLFLVPKDRKPKKVSFLPNTPGKATDFVYWDVS
jgi:hypothetical protein